jgi:alpha-D-ribose 1-methylphosphonate 5-triphosphate synthase subunit PhnI
LSGAVDRVMTEGSIYNTQLAGLALKQASGDMIEAIFLLRAYRTTLSRFATSNPIDTSNMEIERRISATFKDLPGGQVLGPTLDYTHRLLDFSLLAESDISEIETQDIANELEVCPQVMSILEHQGLARQELDEGETTEDITLHPPTYPATRSAQLQQLMRSDEGFLLSIGATQLSEAKGETTLSLPRSAPGKSQYISTLKNWDLISTLAISNLQNAR